MGAVRADFMRFRPEFMSVSGIPPEFMLGSPTLIENMIPTGRNSQRGR
jgi:hypothetical protein